MTIVFASVEKSGCEDANVICIREDTCIAGDPSVQDTCQWIVYLPAEYASVFLFFGRCNPVHPGTGHRIDPLSVLLLYGRQIIRVLHSQYIEDIFFCKVSQAMPGNGFDDMLQSDVIKATILKFRLRFKFTFASGNILHQSFGVGRTIFFLQFGYRCIRRET